MEQADLVVIGLGTAGAAAAGLATRAGLKVIGLDRRPLDGAGARWVNAVPRWCFARAGLRLPEAPELRAEGVPFHLVAGWGPTRLTLTSHTLMEVDMRLLVARLQREAAQAGADLRGGVAVRGLVDGVLQTDAGPIEARWVADASGLAGAGLIDRPRPRPEELCTAAQEVRHVRDRQGALEYLRRYDAAEGETLAFTCVAGGYSVVNVRLDGDEFSILTGSVPATGAPSGRVLLDRFAEDNPWMGEVIFGGARAIPLGRPHLRLAEGKVALLGDAANQVYAMHGSGIGAGLVAASMLVEALAAGGTPDDYNHQWQREWGGLMAGAVAFARFSNTVTPADMSALIQAGLMNPGLARKGLEQTPPYPDPLALPGLALGVARAPRLALRMAPVLTRIATLRALYATCPRDPAQLPAFEARVDRILQG